MSRLSESDTDVILPVSIGTAVWAIALVGLLVARSTLAENGTTWWIAVAVIGLLSGLIGLVFLRWRKGRARRVVEPQE